MPGATDRTILVRANPLIAILAISLTLATLTLALFIYCVRRKLRRNGEKTIAHNAILGIKIYILNYCHKCVVHYSGEDLVKFDFGMTIKSENSELDEVNKRGDNRKKEVKMPLFSFASVSAATENFSDANKLGQGGFGPVYKVYYCP